MCAGHLNVYPMLDFIVQFVAWYDLRPQPFIIGVNTEDLSDQKQDQKR